MQWVIALVCLGLTSCVGLFTQNDDAGSDADDSDADSDSDAGSDADGDSDADNEADSDNEADGDNEADSDGPLNFTFTDEDQVDFSQGTTSGLAYFNGSLQLDTNELMGSIDSRMFSTDGVQAILHTLDFDSPAPVGKPLPDGVTDDSEIRAWVEDGLDLTDLVLLLHFDGTTGTTYGMAAGLFDASDRDHQVTLVDNPPFNNSMVVNGQLREAAFIAYEDYFVLEDADTHPDFAHSTEVFTWAVWMKTAGCGANEDNAIAIGGETPHIWLGVDCPDGDAHWQVHSDLPGEGGPVHSSVTVDDNEWHHLVGVKELEPERTLLYVDGELRGTYEDSWSTFSNFTDTIFLGNFPIGSAPLWSYKSEVTLDELAIFERALSEDEVGALYARGAARLKVQVQVCMDDCDLSPFVGPDGTPSSYFSEEGNALVPSVSPVSLPAGWVGDRFRYRVIFERDSTMVAPRLTNVTLSATSL